MSYEYDDAGRRTSMTYPGGTNEVTYRYDAANRLTSVTDWNLDAITYAYDDAGRMTTKTLPSGTGVVSTYTYDNADRLTGISHVKGGTTTIASVSYTLDDVGNRTQRVDQQGTHTYVYDDLYRLTEVTYPGPATTTYTFDAFGNRLTMTNGAGTTDYEYDDADRLTEVDGPSTSPVTYTWDDNGSLTARGSDSFAWDYEERMTSATVNSVTTTFAYRGDGLRNSRTTGGVTKTFTWDIAAGLPVVIDDGARYVYGAGLEAQVSGSNRYYYLADGLGSTMKTVDSTGAVQKSYTYDVYGKPTATGSLPNEFDFAGQQTDPTGLQYLRARYMDPETGVFISRDALADGTGFLGGSHHYAAGNPTTLVDPVGTWPCIFGVGDCDDDDNRPPEVDDECLLWYAWSRPPQCQEQLEKFEEWYLQQALSLSSLVGEYTGGHKFYKSAPGRVTGWRTHGWNNAMARAHYRSDGSIVGYGVNTNAMKQALQNPSKVVRKVDKTTGEVSWEFRGKDATVVLNDAGEVVTTWATSTKGMRWFAK